ITAGEGGALLRDRQGRAATRAGEAPGRDVGGRVAPLAGDAGDVGGGGRGGIFAARGDESGGEYCRNCHTAGHRWALPGAGSRLRSEGRRLVGGCDNGGRGAGREPAVLRVGQNSPD